MNDQLLCHHRITLEIGSPKNHNKNPVAEKAVQEVENELLCQDPLGGPVSPTMLAVATACLNVRIRLRGLSAREMWSQRDQFSNIQIPMTEQDLIVKQHDQRIANHPHSELSKSPLAQVRPTHPIEVGVLVYIFSDRNKSRARDRYLVVSSDGVFCNLRKFVGSQLRSNSYGVKKSECYRVPAEVLDSCSHPIVPSNDDSSGDDDDPPCRSPSPPSLPDIPEAISFPATLDTSVQVDHPIHRPSVPSSPLPPDVPEAYPDVSDEPSLVLVMPVVPLQMLVTESPSRDS